MSSSLIIEESSKFSSNYFRLHKYRAHGSSRQLFHSHPPDVPSLIKQQQIADKINFTEGRSVLHHALRAPRGDKIEVDGKNVVEDVWKVLDQIKVFSEKVRSGEHKGCTGKKIANIIAIGIGGSYLGPEFVFEALRTVKGSDGPMLNLRFLEGLIGGLILQGQRTIMVRAWCVIIFSRRNSSRP
jgi:glucose-6-phosphate isomerase